MKSTTARLFSLTAWVISAYAILAAFTAHAGPLNDTGIILCRDPRTGADGSCGEAQGGQDARYGRDAAATAGALPKTGGGEAGFDFTKVCMSGEAAGQGACPANPALGTGANDWACTKDNVTGLIWEVKTDDGGLRDKDNGYTNYDDTTQPQRLNGSVNPTQAEIDTATNSIGFLNAVNALTGANRLCGATDWRRPSKKELLSIAHHGRVDPAIDTDYFPNTPSGNFWSGSPFAGNSYYAWSVNFYYGLALVELYANGGTSFGYRDSSFHVRLVHGGQ